MNSKKIKIRLYEVLKREKQSKKLRLGIPQPPKIRNYFSKELIKFLEVNPNNIGTTTRMKCAHNSCRHLENMLIKRFGKLFHGKNVDGYICGGSTEGNIMALWIAREKLSKFGEPVVIAHYGSHYSVDKACRLLRIKLIKTDKDLWREPLNKEKLKKITARLKKNPLIIVSTIGHTDSGVIDNTDSIARFIRSRKIPCFLHIDAAIGGLFQDFMPTSKKFDFRIMEVDSITLDFHKYGFMYYPSGLFLCKKGLQKNIQKKAEYVGMYDDTLCGSRTGIIPAIIWANMELLGRKGIHKELRVVLNNKERFIKKLEEKHIDYFAERYIPLVCLLLRSRLPKEVEKKFRICPSTKGNGLHSYSIFFYPEYNKNYDELIDSL